MAKILWVEDDAKRLECIVRPLKKLGHEIRTAEDAEDALNYLDKEKFDLIILDILIPVGNKDSSTCSRFVGYDLLVNIRNKFNDIPVIVFSVVNDKELNNKLKDLRVDKIIPKSRYMPSQFKEDVLYILNKYDI